MILSTLTSNGGLLGGGAPTDSRVADLGWGWATEARVGHQSGSYFRLTIDARQVENGFVVHCSSVNKDKFKLIMFNSEGQLLFQEECLRTRDKSSTAATLFFTTFPAYRLDDSASSSDKDVTTLYSKLDKFEPCKRTVSPGQYLICVYGENFIGKSAFRISAFQSRNDLPEVLIICFVSILIE